jgi:hypothetical protein
MLKNVMLKKKGNKKKDKKNKKEKKKQEKLKLGASSPGAKQYGEGRTNGPTDQPTNGRTKSFIEALVRG